MKLNSAIMTLCVLLGASQPALSWGVDGHRAIALIAKQCMTQSAWHQVAAMLAADSDPLTAHDIASEATWADKYREKHREQTRNWHFSNIEIDKPDLNKACFGRKPLPIGTLASNGPSEDCVVDKIEQFQAELTPKTDPEERLTALKFLLHLVGDVHQPLHSSDNHDRGGNDIKVIAEGFPHKSRGSHKSEDELHGFWDTQFVEGIRTRPRALAKLLLEEITPAAAAEWAKGSPDDWAMEAFNLGKVDAYGKLPPSADQRRHLDSDYINAAEADVRLQLSRAGIRLAHILNTSLGSEPEDWTTCRRAH